jgi:hypothetical protein
MRTISIKRGLMPLLALGACFSTTLHAEGHGHRHHQAHEHGVGQLNIAIEQHQLHLELESPAMNIVGFEHKPRNEKQHKAVEQAVARLREGEKLFLTSHEAGCSLQQAQVDTSLLEGDDEHHHDGGHDEHHQHDAHHEEEHGEEAHADFTASYRFECHKPEALKSITVKLFAAFPATEELEVQLLSGQGQSATELTSSNPKLEL